MKAIFSNFSALIITIFLLSSCDTNQRAEPETYNEDTAMEHDHEQMAETGANITKAIAVMHPTENNDVSGTVTFEKVEGGIKVSVDVEGLTQGKHGFHVHQWGDCSAPDGTSAGGHFNPHGLDHGGPHSEIRHVGDLGNLTGDANGIVQVEFIDSLLSFSGENNIVGRGLIIHEKEDDLTSQPTGAAGPRVACGVIGVAAAE